MKRAMHAEMNTGNFNFSHFGPEANILDKLEEL